LNDNNLLVHAPNSLHGFEIKVTTNLIHQEYRLLGWALVSSQLTSYRFLSCSEAEQPIPLAAYSLKNKSKMFYKDVSTASTFLFRSITFTKSPKRKERAVMGRSFWRHRVLWVSVCNISYQIILCLLKKEAENPLCRFSRYIAGASFMDSPPTYFLL